MYSHFFHSGEVVEGTESQPQFTAMEQMQQCYGMYQNHPSYDVLQSPLLSPKSSSNLTAATSDCMQFGGGAFPQHNVGSFDGVVSMVGGVDMCRYPFPGEHVENWGDSSMVATSPRTDASVGMESDERNQYLKTSGLDEIFVSQETCYGSKGNNDNHKTHRRLTQNREAARRSRLRKKAYVQQLEDSHSKLAQLQEEVQLARKQGIFTFGEDPKVNNNLLCGGTKAFDIEYAHWLDEHQQKINDLRLAISSSGQEHELQILVDTVMAHYNELFKLKNNAVKSDAFHILSGAWITPAERCFVWLGGFRSSELLKVLVSHVEPMTDQQLMEICNLQHSCQQAEDALSQGMEVLQHSLSETLASGTYGGGSDNVACYVSVMATALGKLSTIENFICQADHLRQQSLQQIYRILTTRQVA